MVAADDLEQRIRDIHAKISYNLDAIPVANWGFSEQVRDALKQRKHALVNQQLTAKEKRNLKTSTKQSVARSVGGIHRTVSDVLRWMSTSSTFGNVTPTTRLWSKRKLEPPTPSSKPRKARTNGYAQAHFEEAADDGIPPPAIDDRQREIEEILRKKGVGKRLKRQPAQKSKAAEQPTNEKATLRNQPAKKEAPAAKQQAAPKKSPAQISNDDESDEDVQRDPSNPLDAGKDVPTSTTTTTTRAARKQEVTAQQQKLKHQEKTSKNDPQQSLEADGDDEGHSELPKSQKQATPAKQPKVPKKETLREPEESFRDDEETTPKPKQSKAQKKLALKQRTALGIETKKAKPAKEGSASAARDASGQTGNGTIETTTRYPGVQNGGKKTTTTKFEAPEEAADEPVAKRIKKEGGPSSKLSISDYQLAYSNLKFLDDQKKKPTKKEKQEKFTGRDYKRLIEKVEKRKEKLEHVREQDPEKAKKLEEDIQWRKVINRAKGQKVKDNPELLKKGLKRKLKTKERRQNQWGERKQKVEQKKEGKQEKRRENIQKRKEQKVKNKIKRANKRAAKKM